MTDRSLNLVVWRVRVASDYRLISTKSSILDALCGAELLMSADDSGATPTGAVRRRLSLQVYPGSVAARLFGSEQSGGLLAFRRAMRPLRPARRRSQAPIHASAVGCRSSAKREDRVSAISPPIASAAARLQAGGDFAKGAAKIGSDGPHHYNGSNGNQCRDQAVLDRRNTFLIFDQTPQAQ